MSLDKLKQTINELIKGNIPIQTVWVTVSEVDWEERTMTAIGIDDEVEFFDVLLGLGSVDLKPKIGSDCLIGIIENQSTISFILMANELEEIDVVIEDCQLNINNGFTIKKEDETLKKIIVDALKLFKTAERKSSNGVTLGLIEPQILAVDSLIQRAENLLKDGD